MRVKQSGSAKIWVLVIVVAVIAGSLLVLSGKFPPGADENAAGTIMPAQRYHSSQITSDDVDVGAVAGGEFAPTDSVDALMSDAANASHAANDGRNASDASDARQ